MEYLANCSFCDKSLKWNDNYVRCDCGSSGFINEHNNKIQWIKKIISEYKREPHAPDIILKNKEYEVYNPAIEFYLKERGSLGDYEVYRKLKTKKELINKINNDEDIGLDKREKSFLEGDGELSGKESFDLIMKETDGNIID